MPASRLALMALAVFMAAPAASATAAVLVTIDKSAQRMMVQVDGSLRWVWPVSTGLPGHDTPTGRYTAFRMEADHFSKEWDDAPMPHSIFFSKTGHAIHGYLNTRRIGTPASHGCVRLTPAKRCTALCTGGAGGAAEYKGRGDGRRAQRGVAARCAALSRRSRQPRGRRSLTTVSPDTDRAPGAARRRWPGRQRRPAADVP